MADEPPSEVRLRRAPRLLRFLIVGGGVGALVTLILTSLFPADPRVGFAALFGYFAVFGIPGGVLLGAIVALLLDRASARRATSALAERSSGEFS